MPIDDDETSSLDDLPGNWEEVDEDTPSVRDTDDGGAIVTLDEDDDGDADDPEFYANLAESMDEGELTRIGTQLLELIERDKEARSERDKQQEDGLRRTGLGDDAPGGAKFRGASTVVHPVLTEACVDFAARAMKEIFPPGGPVKDSIVGKITDDKVAKAKRKTRLMNWQLTVQCPDFRAELEQLMTQVPLGGAQYLKLSWDELRKRPNPLFVAIDDMLLPFAATNFYSAQRKTHVQYVTQLEYEERVTSGMYRDVDIALAGMEPEQSSSGVANDKIEGRKQSSYNEDGLRTMFECYATLKLAGDKQGGDDKPRPYIVTIDKPSTKVLAIYRNWDEDDETAEELQWFVEWPFIPWRGAYPIGLPHMIGGLAAAATGALRALLDSAHINNTAAMLKIKGGTSGGQNLTIEPTQVLEIEGSPMIDDIRKLAMPVPFNQPSEVLFQLLGFLVDGAKGVVRTSLDDMADNMGANTPVGTTLATIEQGAVVYSAIHARLHDAMARMLRILHRLNAMNLDEEALEHETGEELATREDFDGPMDVVPVSDPNIFSETQRYAQVQAVEQRAQQMPQLYDLRKVEELILATIKIPNAEDLLLPPQTPKEQNAVNENVTAALGKPVTAFPEQDHIAHLKAHLSFMKSPMFGGSPFIQQQFLPAMLQHIKEHMLLWYAAWVFDLASEQLGEDLGDVMKSLGHDPKTRKALDGMLAEASMQATETGEAVFQNLPPVLQQAQQLLQQMQQQAMTPGADPRLAIEDKKVSVQAQANAAKAQSDQQKLQLEQQQAAQAAQHDQQQTQVEMARIQQQAQQEEAQRQQAEQERQQNAALAQIHEGAENQRSAADNETKIQTNTADNTTALQIATAEVGTGKKASVSDGTGLNPTP